MHHRDMKNISTPNLNIRRSNERGSVDHGWLIAKHSFSFADYYDPAHIGFRDLRVINEDRVAAGKGFGTHPHSSMEIFTYVISGQLEHKDSMGNGRIIEAGQFQYMSAGNGVLHSEFNPSTDKETHLLQIWITPRTSGGEPRYSDIDTNTLKRPNDLTLFASGTGRNNSIQIRQDAEIHFGQLETGHQLDLPTNSKLPYTWLQMIHGEITLGNTSLKSGDAFNLEGQAIKITATTNSQFLLFQLS